MKADIKAAWVAALRSGEYRQGKGRLHRTDGSFCCLGVLCELARKAGVNGDWVAVADAECFLFDGAPSYLPSSVITWAGVHEQPMIKGVALYRLNDGDEEACPSVRSRTFAEIADLIEQHL